jgi:hypothetical protein
MSQIDKRFTSDQVKELLERYSKKEIERKHIQEILGIGKSRFFMLMSQYREHPQLFTIQYERNTPPRISKDIEHNIVKELFIEMGIILSTKPYFRVPELEVGPSGQTHIRTNITLEENERRHTLWALQQTQCFSLTVARVRGQETSINTALVFGNY